MAERETARLEAFSDGIFAIAITLLILDVRVPRPSGTTGEPFDLARGLVHLWPALLAYFMSFAIVLVLWVNHHRIFTLVRRVDQPFLLWNGLLLMFVTFVPFPTALLSEYMGHGTPHEFRIAAIVYAGHGLLTAIAFTIVWRYAIHGRRLLAPDCSQAAVDALQRQYRLGPLTYAVAFALAFVLPWASVTMCLGVAMAFAVQGLFGFR